MGRKCGKCNREFTLDRRVTVVLDAALMKHKALHFHPLTNTGTTTISRADLVKFLDATGHPPRIELLHGTAEGAS